MTKKNKKTKMKEREPGERFEATKKLLAQYGFKTKAQTSKTHCNALDCNVKLPVHGKEDGKPVSRARWCDSHQRFTQRIRNQHATAIKRGHDPLKHWKKGTYNVRAGKLTLRAMLHKVDADKAMTAYKEESRRGRRFLGLKTKAQKAKAAAKKKAKVLKKVAKKVAAVKAVKAVAKPTPKKVPAPKLKALLNGKGADVQAAVAAHAARKAAEAKK